MNFNTNTRVFSREGKIAEILQDAVASIPPKTKVYMIGGAARNLVYMDIFKKALPQRDYDMLVVGDFKKFISNVHARKFTYGKIRRINEVVLKKKLVPKPKDKTDYAYLDIDRGVEPDVMKSLKDNAAFTINGFAIPLQYFLSKDFRKHVIALPGALEDLKKKRLRLNYSGYQKHAGNLFSCLRFMSIGFAPPPKNEVQLLLDALPKLEKWRFARNVRKVYGYVGGETRARKLVKRLGIDVDVFDIKTLREKM